MAASDLIPVFHPEGVQAALVFKKRTGDLNGKLKKPPRKEPSRAPEIDYVRRLNALLAELFELVREKVVPKIPAIVADAPIELRQRQDVGELLEETIGDLRLLFAARAPLEMIARRVAGDAEARSAEDQKRIVQTVLGIRPEIAEPWLDALIKAHSKTNARLVGQVTDDFINRLERKISDRMREGLRAEEIQKEIEAEFVSSQGLEAATAKKRAKLIARDQIASLTGDVTRVRQERIGVKRYRWRTALDERVRSSHLARENEIFFWGNAIQPQLRAKGLPVDRVDGHPGKPINCRCFAEPILSDIIPDIEEI